MNRADTRLMLRAPNPNSSNSNTNLPPPLSVPNTDSSTQPHAAPARQNVTYLLTRPNAIFSLSDPTLASVTFCASPLSSHLLTPDTESFFANTCATQYKPSASAVAGAATGAGMGARTFLDAAGSMAGASAIVPEHDSDFLCTSSDLSSLSSMLHDPLDAFTDFSTFSGPGTYAYLLTPPLSSVLLLPLALSNLLSLHAVS